MPIRPENIGVPIDWGMHIRDIVPDDERQAIDVLRVSGFDALRQPFFWESIVARHMGGELTAHKALHDIRVDLWGLIFRAEVKFSNAFETTLRVKGRAYRRTVFKWALPRGKSGKHTADACILIGLDVNRLAYAWVIPRDEIAPDCRSITLTAPSLRGSAIEGRLDRRAGIQARARAQRASGDLFTCKEEVSCR